MKYISGGHCTVQGPNYDPGAVGVNGITEASQTLRVRNKVVEILRSRGEADIIQDMDGESLKQYLNRIKPGNGSVVVEFHFNAFNGKATGTEVVVGDNADRLDKMFAQDLVDRTAYILGIPLRGPVVNGKQGVIPENATHRGRLGLMREEGIVALVEICFIDNPSDMEKFNLKFDRLCHAYADVIQQYDAMIK